MHIMWSFFTSRGELVRPSPRNASKDSRPCSCVHVGVAFSKYMRYLQCQVEGEN